jgi:hypothetical protein
MIPLAFTDHFLLDAGCLGGKRRFGADTPPKRIKGVQQPYREEGARSQTGTHPSAQYRPGAPVLSPVIQLSQVCRQSAAARPLALASARPAVIE